jgi:prepilin-type N-terminal cleavage/methylation domain-containing protein
MKTTHPQKLNGFTLIELLVVISIIGILTAVLLVNMIGIRERGADAKAKSDLNQLQTALRLYYNDNQHYPLVNGDCRTVLGGGSDKFRQSTPPYETYMNNLPDSCFYSEEAGGEGFMLRTILKNTGDPDIDVTGERCIGGMGWDDDTYYICTE